MEAQTENDQIQTLPLVDDVEKPIDPGVELEQLRKELSDKEEKWAKEREELLVQLEKKNEWLRAKDEELKLQNEKMASQRVHKLVEINTLARLVEESLSLAEYYRKQATEAKSEVQENTLELQVLQSAFEYARKEIHDLDATRNKLVGKYISAAEKERRSKRERKILYRALGDAEHEIKALRKETSGKSEKVLEKGFPKDETPIGKDDPPKLSPVNLPKISYEPESARKSNPVDEKVTGFLAPETLRSPRTLKTAFSVPFLKGEMANNLFKVPSENDLNDKAGLLPQIDHELDPIGSTPQPPEEDNVKIKDQQRESSSDLDNESPLYTPSSAGNRSGSPSESNGITINIQSQVKRDSVLSGIGQDNSTSGKENSGDLWRDSGALLLHIDPELEPEPLPNVLKHQKKESGRIGDIRKLMGNFRRVKKSMAGLGALSSLSPSVLAITEQISMSSDMTFKRSKKSGIGQHDSPSEATVDEECVQNSKDSSASKEYFSYPEKETVIQETNEDATVIQETIEDAKVLQETIEDTKVIQETIEDASSKKPAEEASEDNESESESQHLVKVSSDKALNELSEIQSGTNGKLILTKTNISNLQRRINYLSGLSLGFFDKSRLTEVQKQLEVAKCEIDRMKKTNKRHIENALSMISENDLSKNNEDTARIIAGAKRKLSDVGFLTELDIISFTVESIGDEVATMEVKEIGEEGSAEAANIATESDLNFLEEMLRVWLTPQKFEDVLKIVSRTRDAFTRIETTLASLRQYLHESRKVIFKQTKEIRENSHMLKIVHEHAENLTSENKTYKENLRKAKEKLNELKDQFLLEKTTLIERVSEEMHRLRCLG